MHITHTPVHCHHSCFFSLHFPVKMTGWWEIDNPIYLRGCYTQVSLFQSSEQQTTCVDIVSYCRQKWNVILQYCEQELKGKYIWLPHITSNMYTLMSEDTRTAADTTSTLLPYFSIIYMNTKVFLYVLENCRHLSRHRHRIWQGGSDTSQNNAWTKETLVRVPFWVIAYVFQLAST